MSFILVKTNVMVNLNQIVAVEYTPAASGIDEETNKPFSHPSELDITTTAVSAEKLTGYDGEVQGCASESAVVFLRGEEADKVWAFFTDPSKQVKNTIERVIA